MRNLSFSEDPRFAELVGAMRSALWAGGERVRAVLCMEVAGSFGLDPAEVLPSAAAVELIHTGSLVHDDLPAMGGSRCNRPAGREESGDATAILAGNACFSESLNLISFHQNGSPEQILEIVRELAGSVGTGGVVGGQVIGMGRNGQKTDPETLNTMHDYRTGTLFKASARVGAILAGATEEEKERVSEYARWLGLCSRLVDDLLDAGSTAGKPDRNGADREKATFVRVYGLSETRRLADESLRGALEPLDGLDGDMQGLAEMARFARYRGGEVRLSEPS